MHGAKVLCRLITSSSGCRQTTVEMASHGKQNAPFSPIAASEQQVYAASTININVNYQLILLITVSFRTKREMLFYLPFILFWFRLHCTRATFACKDAHAIFAAKSVLIAQIFNLTFASLYTFAIYLFVCALCVRLCVCMCSQHSRNTKMTELMESCCSEAKSFRNGDAKMLCSVSSPTTRINRANLVL